MMNRNIPHDAAGPAFYQRDVTFTKIVVDNEVTISHFGGKSQDYTIYFAGKCVLFTKYALSFYRPKKFLGWSKFSNFWAGSKNLSTKHFGTCKGQGISVTIPRICENKKILV
jgi:hypothetical protein